MTTSAVATSLVIEAVKRSFPGSIKWIVNYIKGVDILFIGPSGSGKTSVSDYLQFGVLETEQKHFTTIEVAKSPLFTISMGRDSSLNLSVRKSIDIPGQVGPDYHAMMASQQDPHCLVVVLSFEEKDDDAVNWLKQCFQRIEEIKFTRNDSFSRLRSIIILLNKRDKADQGREQALIEKVDAISAQHLKPCFGGQFVRTKVACLPCVAVQQEGFGVSLIDAFVLRLAKFAK